MTPGSSLTTVREHNTLHITQFQGQWVHLQLALFSLPASQSKRPERYTSIFLSVK